ncbi:MAG TPA: hypothetical protein VHB50_13950, partial [Bryobacteraceae bacterium]|nr:hypothetical protein [Bryobacteraceae bacterium]
MAYVSSSANRWYCAKESGYGALPSISAANRIPAVQLTAQQQRVKSQRKDKTGSRTWAGMPQGMRKQTTFGLTSYMRDWPDQTALPPHGPLFEAALGGAGTIWAGGTPNTGTGDSNIQFVAPHGLEPGQAVVSGGEIRFVAAIADANTVILNAPFTTAPVPGVALGATATYGLGASLPSVSLFDYWDPASAVQRVLAGAAVDRLSVKLNGDFHQFDFKGMAQDVLDSASFAAGQGGATTFPAEPGVEGSSYSPVPGNLGQVWLGVIPNQFLTVSSASVEIRNNLDMRNREFGSLLPQGIAPGTREVSISLELFSQDDIPTASLYQAARQQAPMGVMFQLGQAGGQLLGI